MMQWDKKGVIFKPEHLERKPIWMNSFAQAPNALIFDDFIRVYFCTRRLPDIENQFVSYGAYVDLDKNNPSNIISIATEPVLELGSIGEFDEYGTYPISYSFDSVQKNKVIAVYGGWTRCESVPFNISLGLAQSTNGGKTFNKIGNGPILSHTQDDPFVVTSPKIRFYDGKWYLFYTSGTKWIRDDNGNPEIIYKLRMATSIDLINWHKIPGNIISDVIGIDEAQACPDVVKYGNKYHMFFCYRYSLDFRSNSSRSYKIGYAYSEDLINWKRDDKQINFDVSIDSWDSEMVAYPNVVVVEDKVYMFYGGNGNGKTGFGYAELMNGLPK